MVYSGPMPQRKKTPISVRIDLERRGIFTGRGGWVKNAMLLKESLKQINRLKSNCSANSSIYALLMVHRLFLILATTMPVHRIMLQIHA